MFKFFAALRAILALDRAQQSLGAVVHDAINKVIIPRLQKMALSSRDPDKYEALIAEYRQYADLSNSKSRVFADYAEEIVDSVARRYNRSREDAETVAQDMATVFYTNPREMSSFDVPRFDPETGPTGLVKYWRHILNNKAMYAFRELVRKSPYKTVEEGEDPFRNVRAPDTEREQREYEDIERELRVYVEGKIKSMGSKGKFLMEVFQKWMSAISEIGTRLNVEKDVIEPIMRNYRSRGESVSRQTVYNAVRTIREMSEKFMRGLRSGSIKAGQKLGCVDALVYEEFRKQLASWVLGQ